MTPRVHFVGNTCNYAFQWAKLSRELELDGAAFIERGAQERDLPWWDDPSVSERTLPEWVGWLPSFRHGGLFLDRRGRAALDELGRCDVVHAFGGMAALWAMRTGRRFVYHSYGDIASTPFPDRPWTLTSVMRAALARRAMARAHTVVLSQLPDLTHAERLGLLDRTEILPMIYDYEAVSPERAGPIDDLVERYRSREVLFYIPSRQIRLKRQDKALRAFARFVAERSEDALLLIARWGDAVEERVRLIAELEIGDRVEWVPCLRKTELMRYLSLPRLAVLDEFEDPPCLMSFGGVSRDAMAMQAVLISRISMERITELHRTPPPILFTEPWEESIFERMIEFADMSEGERRDVGRASRAWLVEEHDHRSLLPRYHSIYEKCML